jgi:hypothetical protein
MSSHRPPIAKLVTLAAALVLSLILVAPASAKVKSRTILTPNQSSLATLSAYGITVVPTGDATPLNRGAIAFPIVRGFLNPDAIIGQINTSGGLTFSDASGNSLTFENFRVKLGEKDVIRADVAGGKIRLADLDLDDADVKERGDRVVINPIGVELAHRASLVLTEVFGLPDLGGLDLGEAKVKARV